jgi:hypothetical protein
MDRNRCHAEPPCKPAGSAPTKLESTMVGNSFARLVREDRGMEMVEWSIVGVIFALASALLWNALKIEVNSGLDKIGKCVGDSKFCP